MTALALAPMSFFARTFSRAEPSAEEPAPVSRDARRKIIGDMIAAGGCDGEHGVFMLMSVYPDQF